MRNNTLDFLRGLAIFNIIIIHTLWWSGESYISNPIFRELSLLFEVPLFFYLSGFTAQLQRFHFKKFGLRFLKLYGNYLVFFLFFILCLFLYETFLNHLLPILKLTFSDIKNWVLFQAHPEYEFIVSGLGTLWFLHVFIPIYLTIPALFWLKKNKSTYLILLFGLLILIFENRFPTFKISNIFYNLQYLIFYFFIFALGYFNLKIKNKIELFSSLLMLLFTIFLIRGNEIFTPNFQALKFPPQGLYLLFSLFSILISAYFLTNDAFLKNKKNWIIKFFNYSGKNSLWIYFCQGISSSLIFSLLSFLEQFKLNAFFTFFICLGFNVLSCYFLVFLLIRFNCSILKILSTVKSQGQHLCRHK